MNTYFTYGYVFYVKRVFFIKLKFLTYEARIFRIDFLYERSFLPMKPAIFVWFVYYNTWLRRGHISRLYMLRKDAPVIRLNITINETKW